MIKLHNQRQSLIEAQAKARRALAIAREEVQAGSVSALDLLVSEQTVVSADDAVATSDAAVVQDQIAVFKALAGGWEEPRTAVSAQRSDNP